jgi:hypothetical protein
VRPKLDSRLATLLRAASPRGEPDPVESADESGERGRIVLATGAKPMSLTRAARRRAGDGLLAVAATPHGLRSAQRILEQEGLAHRGTFLRSSRALVQASAGGRRLFAEQSVLPRTRTLALRFAPFAVAARSATPLALFTHRDGPHPLAWVSADGAGAATLIAGHRSESVSIRVESAGAFAKWATAADDVGRLTRAHERSDAFAPGARSAGFDVPESRLLRLGGAAALVTAARPGHTAASILRRRPSGLPDLADRVVSTLEAWNLGSRQVTTFGTSRAARQLLSDLEVLEPQLDPVQAGTIRRQLSDFAAETLPVAPAHGDVSMWNLVVGPRGLTLVDWEAACEEMLPGFDAEYALVDATAAASSYADRIAAFSRAPVDAVRRRIAATTGLPATIAPLVPVSCWAHHAANEVRSGGHNGSFLAILRLVLADVLQ